MDEAERRAMESELLFYITAALVTFLAIVVSFKWVYRKTVTKPTLSTTTSTTSLVQQNLKTSSTETGEDQEDDEEMENSCPVHSKLRRAQAQSHTSDKSQQMSSGDGSQVAGDEDLADIQDVLINHDDIKPVGAATLEEAMSGTTTTVDEGTGDDVVLGEDGKPLIGPQKTKKLVEEVSKMMSDEQKAEERRIQAEQLQAIFSLVQDQQDRFGIETFEDIQDQFKLYA